VIPNVKLDDLTNGLGEWRNIQAVIRATFRSLCDTIVQQNYTIQSLQNRFSFFEKQLKEKVTRAEVAMEVNRTVKDLQQLIETKAATVEIAAALDKKANKDEVRL
jgi:hypothetical protein